MSSSHFSISSFTKPADDDVSSLLSEKVKSNIYSDPISQKPKKNRLTGLPLQQQPQQKRISRAGFSVLSAFDRHKQLVNNYLTYYGPKGRSAFKPDKSKYKRDIDVVRENHRFLWEDEEGDEVDSKELKWEQRIAKKYWDKLFKEYAITDLTDYKKNRIAFRWRIEKEVVDGKGQFICGQKKTCKLRDGLRTWEVNFGYVEDEMKKFALVKVRLCAECRIVLKIHYEIITGEVEFVKCPGDKKLNHNKKYREVRREQNRLAILREKEEAVQSQLDSKRSETARKRKLNENEDPDQPKAKTKLTEKEQRKKIEDDEEQLRNTEATDDIWERPSQVEEDKTKEQEFDEYFKDLFLVEMTSFIKDTIQDFYESETFSDVRRMDKRQVYYQFLNFAMIVSSALMVWKGLFVISGTESPIVVVLSGSMEPAFFRGDLLFLYHDREAPVDAGEIVVFKIEGRDIPIVHRVIKRHENTVTNDVKILTKGDNNQVDDRALYNRGQLWIEPKDIVGRAKGMAPYVGMVTIIMNDYPKIKWAVLAVLTALTLLNREAQSYL